MQLRPYQQQAIVQIEGHFNTGIRSVLYQLPTGGGKTVVFSSIITKWVQANKRVCVLVHRVELLNQAAETLRKLGINSGRIKGKERYDHQHLVHVASVQTLSRNKSAYPPDLFDLLVVDEAHHAVAGSWDRVIKRFNTAKVLGVSATPCRLDGRGLGNAFDVLIEGPQPVTLSEQGFLAPAKVYAPPPKFEPGKLKTRMGDFQLDDASSQLSAVHVIGDVITHYKKHLKGSTAIAFCCSIAHAESVAAGLAKAGIPSASIDGSMTEEQRASLLAQLASKSIKVLTSCALIGEGVDVPSVGGCILLRPTKSLALFLQMVGRCLRPDGDSFAVVLDHVGNYQRLGHHLLERSWSLADGVSLTATAKATDGTTGWLCQSCDLLAPKHCDQCPECGTHRPVTEKEIITIDAELVEVQRQQAIAQDYDFDQKVDKALERWLLDPFEKGDAVFVDFPAGYFSRYSRWREPDPNPTDRIGWIVNTYSDEGLFAVKLKSHPASGMKEYVPPEWLTKDPERGRDDCAFWEKRARENKFYRELEDAKDNAKTLEDLIDVGRRFSQSNPVGWAKTIMWHRNGRPPKEPGSKGCPELENAKRNAKTLEELIEVAERFNKRSPVAWAKTVLWHRNGRTTRHPAPDKSLAA
jgi:superfamily II DNA or RNA helicase